MESLLPVYPNSRPSYFHPLPSPSNSYRCHSLKNGTFSLQLTKPPKLTARTPKKNPIFTTNRSSKARTRTRTTTTDVLRLMDSLGLPITIDIYASLIKECTITRDSSRAIELHAHIKKQCIFKNPEFPLSMFNRILIMYVSCSCLEIARQVFDEMTYKDFNSWATLIVGYLDSGDSEEALNLFVDMIRHIDILEVEFPLWIINCILNACVDIVNMGLGIQVHGWLLKLGVSNDSFLTTSLISFYGKFKCLGGANLVFEKNLCRNTVVWTAKIIYNCKEECFYVVANDFKEMRRAGIKKNCYTFSSVLKACGRIKDDGNYGQQVHAEAIKLGVESNVFVQCGLVDMYGKFGLLRDARTVFDSVNDRNNIACWNAMLTVYKDHGSYVEGIKLLYQMKAAGLQPQESMLKEMRIACGSV